MYSSFGSIASNFRSSVDLPQPGSDVITANSFLSATYIRRPSTSLIAFVSYRHSGGRSLVNGVWVMPKNASYMSASLLSVVRKGDGIGHEPFRFLVPCFESIQQSGGLRCLWLHRWRQRRCLSTVVADHQRFCSKWVDTRMADRKDLWIRRIIGDLNL